VENIIGFVGNFIPFSAVKEFWKSAKISESHCQKFGGFLFLEHSVYGHVKLVAQ